MTSCKRYKTLNEISAQLFRVQVWLFVDSKYELMVHYLLQIPLSPGIYVSCEQCMPIYRPFFSAHIRHAPPREVTMRVATTAAMFTGASGAVKLMRLCRDQCTPHPFPTIYSQLHQTMILIILESSPASRADVLALVPKEEGNNYGHWALDHTSKQRARRDIKGVASYLPHPTMWRAYTTVGLLWNCPC